MKSINSALLMCVSIAFLSSCIHDKSVLAIENTKNRRLKCIDAPFMKGESKNEFKTSIFKPVVKNDKIIFGNKEIKLNENGMMEVYVNGTKTASLFQYFRTNNYVWITCEDAKRFKLSASKMENTYEYKGKFSIEKEDTDGKVAAGEYNQVVSLLNDGQIKVDIQWTVPENYTKSVKGECFFISFPSILFKNEKIEVDDKIFTIPKKDEYGFFKKATPHEITFFPNRKDTSLSMRLVSCELALGATQDTQSAVRLWGKKEKNGKRLTFIVDLREGVSNNFSKDTYGGIDFQKVEAFDMPDFRSSKNLIRNPSFEQGLKDYRINNQYCGYEVDERKWEPPSYQIDDKQAKFGSSCLKIKTFSEKRSGDYRGLVKPGNITTLPIPLESGTYTFSFYAKGNRPSKQDISVWCPNASWFGNHFLPMPKAKKIFKITDNWSRYSLTFDVPKSMPFQVNFNAISKTGDGSVWIDGLQLEKSQTTSPYEGRPVEGKLVTSASGNFLKTNQPVNARLQIFTKPETSGKAKITVKDFFSEILYDKEYGFKSDRNGLAQICLPFDDKFSDGIYVVKAEYELKDGTRTYDIFRFSIMDFLENKHRLKNIFADLYSCYAYNPNFFNILDRWKKIGIGARCHMKCRDKKIFDIYDHYGIDVTDCLMMTVYRNRQANKRFYQIGLGDFEDGPNSKEILIDDFRMENSTGELTSDYLRRFEEAVARVAKKRPWIKMWAFGGENGAKWPDLAGNIAKDEEFDKFVQLQIAFYNGVKKGNPEAKVFNGDPCNMRPDGGIKLIDRLLTTIGGKIKYDLIGIHPYRATPENPDLDSDVETLLSVLDKHGYKDTPVFFPEGMHWGAYNIPQWGIVAATWGPPKTWYYGALSYDMGWTEKITAAWRARSWLVALKYQDRVKASMSASTQNNFELDIELTPYATQKISNTLGNLLGNARFVKDVRFAPYSRCYIFEDERDRPVAAVWNCHPKIDGGMMKAPIAEANFIDSEIEIFDLMQAKRLPEKDKNGNIQFPVSSFPLFFRGESGSLQAMVKAIEHAQLISGEGIAPLTIAGKPSTPKKMDIMARNMLSQKFIGDIIVNGMKKQIVTLPSQTTNIMFDLPQELKSDHIVDEHVDCILNTGKSDFRTNLSFKGFVCLKARAPIHIDGNIEDWKTIPTVSFKNRTILYKNLKTITDNDSSGKFRVAWDKKGLYLCVEVTDDKFAHKEFSETGKRWDNDCLQIYFDTLCDARLREKMGYDRNDYDYAIFPSSDGKESVVYRYHSPDRQLTFGTEAPDDNTIEPNIKSAFKKLEHGYIYEVFFPAKYLLPFNIEKGSSLGIGLYIPDCDDKEEKYGRRVKSGLTLAPNGKGCYNRPDLWPVMLLWE